MTEKINNTNTKKIFILLFVVVTAIFYISKDVKLFSEVKELPVFKLSAGDCNIQRKGCAINTDEFKLSILLDKDIYYLRPFNISISSEINNPNIEKININFKMVGMIMGVNKFTLKENSSSKDKQNWQGKALLPICVAGRADWFADLEFITKQVRYILSVPITVQQAVN